MPPPRPARARRRCSSAAAHTSVRRAEADASLARSQESCSSCPPPRTVTHASSSTWFTSLGYARPPWDRGARMLVGGGGGATPTVELSHSASGSGGRPWRVGSATSRAAPSSGSSGATGGSAARPELSASMTLVVGLRMDMGAAGATVGLRASRGTGLAVLAPAGSGDASCAAPPRARAAERARASSSPCTSSAMRMATALRGA
mmetsp:Transcript_8047/g.23674  ORF Transcript_8047/g.23674 Transcript_8047/m.23674 type:complete len:204 (+) Transcript_8047:159-770(+)